MTRFKKNYIIPLLLIFPFVYCLSPIFTIILFRNSVRRMDPNSISSYINYPQLRKNFKLNITSELIANTSLFGESKLPENIRLLLIKPIVSAIIDSTINSYGFYSLITYGRIIKPRSINTLNKDDITLAKRDSVYGFSYPNLNLFILKLETEKGNQAIKLIWKREYILSWRIHSLIIPMEYIYDSFSLLRE